MKFAVIEVIVKALAAKEKLGFMPIILQQLRVEDRTQEGQDASDIEMHEAM